MTAAHRDSYAIADLSVNSMGLTLVQHFEYMRELKQKQSSTAIGL